MLDRLLALPGVTSLSASGRDVGLPDGFIGNSEVGHLNIGAGRVVYQDMTRIDLAIENGTLFENPVILDLCAAVRARGGRSTSWDCFPTAVCTANIRHLEALIKLAGTQGVSPWYMRLWTVATLPPVEAQTMWSGFCRAEGAWSPSGHPVRAFLRHGSR